jgi:glycolate oxidase FAD binding subunit
MTPHSSTPRSIEALVEIVRDSARLLAVGARTKPRLSEPAAPFTPIDMRGLAGIVEYEPSEFTFTALAGTPLREIAAALAEREQYLPFDPPFVQSGATLGGTVAAGLSGPGRFRYGGLRDFILGVRFIDGMGRLLRLGGKVVKNAAGFDVPKFFAGSLGRFGVLVEITFKVFPRAAAFATLRIPAASTAEMLAIFSTAASARWEIDALESAPGGEAVLARLGAPAEAIEALTAEVLARWPQGERLGAEDASAVWREIGEFSWADGHAHLIRVPTSPRALPALVETLRRLPEARWRCAAGGNLLYIATGHSPGAIHEILRATGSAALALRGDGPLLLGTRRSSAIEQRVKEALDPQHRFPPLDDASLD